MLASQEACQVQNLFRLLGTVLRAGLLAVLDALRIERTTDDVITHTGKILHTTTADHDDRVLLKIMTLARNVGRNFHTAGELHTSDLTKSRVRLLWCRGINTGADAAALRTILEGRRLRLERKLLAT